jgi:hypothetical protein
LTSEYPRDATPPWQIRLHSRAQQGHSAAQKNSRTKAA